MKVLVACEFSGRVRDAFVAHGHDAWSCDLLPTAQPGNHHQGDVREILDKGWDLMVAHPDCTYLTISAAWAFKDGPYHQKVKPGTLVGAARRKARDEAVEFFRLLMDAPISRIAIENPVGFISSIIRKPDQVIQPWQFGHPESKSTCLWLKNLPLLQSTNILPKPASGRWDNQTPTGQNKLGPSATRWMDRAKTYTGIANAIGAQWGGCPLSVPVTCQPATAAENRGALYIRSTTLTVPVSVHTTPKPRVIRSSRRMGSSMASGQRSLFDNF